MGTGGRYPGDPAGQSRAACVTVIEIDARGIAERLGDPRLANSVMLGAAATSLPLGAGTLRNEVLFRFAKHPALAELNARAFDAGQAPVH